MGERIHSIDSMRIIAMLFVVAIHTDLFRNITIYGNMINFAIDSSARFAVPFFFVTSGYFFARKTANRDPVSYFVKRATTIASIYVFGLLLSAPVFLAGTAARAGIHDQAVTASVVGKLAEFTSPVALFYYGNSVSEILWFLPALLVSLGLICLFVLADKTSYLLPISVSFHVVGLLGASYTMFVDVPFEIRDALFFGFFYTSLGYYIASRDWQPAPEWSRRYLGATVLFSALHVGERYVLGYVVGDETFAHGVYTASYSVVTVLVTLSLFAFLLSRPSLGRSTSLPSWGKYAVGVYVVHPAVLFALETIGELLVANGYEIESSLWWHLVLTPATFFGALFVYLLATKHGVVEVGGSHLPGTDRLWKYDLRHPSGDSRSRNN
ncbi:acyltransferase [Natrialba aegyptia]|nr:acyltransferase [Natrialba aegyptia]